MYINFYHQQRHSFISTTGEKCELKKIEEQFLADEFDIDALVVEEEGIKSKASDKNNAIYEQTSIKKRKGDADKGPLGKAQNNGKRDRRDKIQNKKRPSEIEGKYRSFFAK